MRPLLVVGCGGSGGVTLQFLMDQLKADLAARNFDTLPAAWQFVHVDVPAGPDGSRPGLPPTVPQQGGRYVGIADSGTTYPQVAASVERQLREQRALGELATWRIDPREVDTSISTGAGQMRGVGRMATLSGLRTVRENLQAAYDAAKAPAAIGELQRVAAVMSPETQHEPRDYPNPLVIVVSSMAGGAGASMVLDVCRTLTLISGYDPRLTALFLYTPEVFEKIPEDKRQGIEGNALAMTGELIATQTRAAAEGDQRLLAALGLPLRDAVHGTFRRVIPIGARIGASGALFAEGRLDDIYRGVGRGLAALLSSGGALGQFIAYDLTNSSARQQISRSLGWAVSADALQWGTFGFASLALGRDRYKEYAAQCLARAATDRVAEGHLRPGDRRTGNDQIRDQIGNRFPDFCAKVGLPGIQSINEWLAGLLQDPASRAATDVVGRVVDPKLAMTQQVQAKQWLPFVTSSVQQAEQQLVAEVDDAAYRWAFGLYTHILENIEREVDLLITSGGAVFARAMLDQLLKSLDGWVQELKVLAANGPQRISQLPPEVEQQANAVSGAIDGRHGIVGVLRQAYWANAGNAVWFKGAHYAHGVLSGMRIGLLDPLNAALEEVVSGLTVARSARPVDEGIAHVATNEYALWPQIADEVPVRFTQALNEVLLTPASSFRDYFHQHVEAERANAGFEGALPAVISEIVSGRWQTTGARRTYSLVEQRVRWRPKVLSRDPQSPRSEFVPERLGRYQVAAKPLDLLERARDWIGRPDTAFSDFIGETLSQYIAADRLSEFTRADRLAEIERLFAETLTLARPLVGINAGLVQEIHNESARPSFKFSNVPFGQELGNRLVRTLEQSDAEQTSVDRLRSALSDDEHPVRIDVFGSYAPLSPAAFSSLLAPMDEKWASSVLREARTSFWHRRRSRQLPGGLPMGDSQRKALVGGWYVARYTGRLRFADEYMAGRAIQVWDDDSEQWLSFPDPLIVPQDILAREGGSVRLPAVLMSILLALARSSRDSTLEPLLPYTVLRMLWDDSESGRAEYEPNSNLAAARHLENWLAMGSPASGAPAEFAATDVDRTVRHKLLQDRVDKARESIGHHFLAPGQNGAIGGGSYSVIEKPERLPSIPLFREVAPDAYEALTVLDELLGLGGPSDIPVVE